MNPLFVGSGVALVTPFDEEGQIDFEGFAKLIDFQIENGSDAIIVCGTTGEGSTLSVDERLKLFSLAKEKIKGRIPLLGGTGSNSTFFTLDLAEKAEKAGVDAHLMVTPYYNKTSQQGLIKHYTFLADRLTKPIFIYNVPSRTGVNVAPETYEALSYHPNIIGVKEADPNISKLIKSICLCKDRLTFYIGNDDLITTSAYLGCKGVISVLSNILPGFTRKMTMSAILGDVKNANDMQENVIDLIEALFSDVNPIPIKEAMKYLGMDTGYLRGPLCNMPDAKRENLIKILEAHRDKLENELI